MSVALPWQDDPVLRAWDIVGMNHYRVGGERRLFVAMTRAGRSIVAEGADEPQVFVALHRQAADENASLAFAVGWAERWACNCVRSGEPHHDPHWLEQGDRHRWRDDTPVAESLRQAQR